MDTVTVALHAISPFPDNPRRGDIDAIRASLRRFGQQRPILVQKATGYIVAGNHVYHAIVAEDQEARARTAAGQDLPKGMRQWDGAWVAYTDLSEVEAKAYVLADNQLSARGQNDPDALHRWLLDLYNRDAIDAALGFDPDELNRLLRIGRGGKGDPDDVPDESPTPWVQPGMMIALGRHRVICADATDEATYTRLLGSSSIDCIWTDPPYGAEYRGRGGHIWAERHQKREAIEGDARDDEAVEDMLSTSLGLALQYLRAGRALYVHANPGAALARFIDVTVRLKVYRETLAWVKDSFVLARHDFHPRWEPIIYGWKAGARHFWAGDRTQDTVWEFPRPHRSDAHPTMKPVELVERALTLSTRKGEVVLDMFAGSGTAVIAAERTGRTCCAIEVKPSYVQIICERWAAQTGQEPVIIGQEAS